MANENRHIGKIVQVIGPVVDVEVLRRAGLGVVGDEIQGREVDLRSYGTSQQITEQMLRDVNHWIMSGISTAAYL